ncbi:MAG: ABC transporter permease [Oligoflexia bacterium]|nr:ABC transporter permease [Oligoflexia bacterium]
MQALRFLSPLGIDIFCLGKKFLVFNLISRNLKIKYRRSILGLFWTLLGPIAMTAVYYFVFKVVLKVDIPHYTVFILSGVLFWNFFAQTIVEGMESIVGNWGLVSKVPIQLQVFPYVGALTNLVTLGLALPVVFAACFFSKVPVGPSLLLLPFYTLALFFMAYGFAFVLSIGFVFFRDLRHMMGIFIQIWFYSTPVIYNESLIPEKFQWILYANPVGLVFSGLHQVFIYGAWPSEIELLTVVGWSIASLGAAVLLHHRYGRTLVEMI